MRKERDMNMRRCFGLNSANRRRGFTLAEVMIVVAIIGILSAIAYPIYQDQLRKGRRASAQTFMLSLASKQQQYLADSRQYALGATFLTTLSQTTPTDVATYYTLTVEPAIATTPPSFTLVATPQGPQAADGILKLTHLGGKERGGTAGW
jgi:type IV pilus assembly protein PilE